MKMSEHLRQQPKTYIPGLLVLLAIARQTVIQDPFFHTRASISMSN